MSKPKPHKPGTFCWFECATTDAATAARFYTDLFGWNSAQMPMPGEEGQTYTLLKIGDADIAGLYQMTGPQFQGVPSHWDTYVAVKSADESASRARKLGATTLVPPMDVPGVGRIAMMTDPTGANFSLFQAGDHPGAAQLGPRVGTIGWSELHTRDTARAGAFYSELFGWKLKKDDGPMPYTEFQVGKESIGGMMAMTPEHGDAPPNWLPYVMVDDCDRYFRRAGELGGKTCVPPMDIPNVGRFAVFSDPTGGTLAMIHLTS